MSDIKKFTAKTSGGYEEIVMIDNMLSVRSSYNSLNKMIRHEMFHDGHKTVETEFYPDGNIMRRMRYNSNNNLDGNLAYQEWDHDKKWMIFSLGYTDGLPGRDSDNEGWVYVRYSKDRKEYVKCSFDTNLVFREYHDNTLPSPVKFKDGIMDPDEIQSNDIRYNFSLTFDPYVNEVRKVSCVSNKFSSNVINLVKQLPEENLIDSFDNKQIYRVGNRRLFIKFDSGGGLVKFKFL